MERVSVSLIEEIRSALIERYNRDQEIQQMIEEIGAEEGLNEKELTIIHQAYLEVKERMQYTANLMELWNQIEVVQERISMLNSYESLERDLFGDVLSFDKPMGYGTTNHEQLDYAMEKIKLQDIDKDFEDFNLTETYPIHKQTVSSNTLNEDNKLDTEDHLDDENNERVLHKDVHTSLDPFDMVNSLLYSKQSSDDKNTTKQQKEIDKLIKKQLKRVEEEWAKLSEKNTKKDKKKKDKDKKKDKKDKKSKKDVELVKESSKSKKEKKDKESKKNKRDMDSINNKKNKDAKKDQKSKKLEKSLKKESKKSGKKD